MNSGESSTQLHVFDFLLRYLQERRGWQFLQIRLTVADSAAAPTWHTSTPHQAHCPHGWLSSPMAVAEQGARTRECHPDKPRLLQTLTLVAPRGLARQISRHMFGCEIVDNWSRLTLPLVRSAWIVV